MTSIFHLAFAVKDLAETRAFYQDILGCRLGRCTEHWQDIDFFGHQLSAHLSSEEVSSECSDVDGLPVPLRHFGVVLDVNEWQQLADRLDSAGIGFVIPPAVRYRGKTGEQHTFFITDPSNNGIEFKTFVRHDEVFSS